MRAWLDATWRAFAYCWHPRTLAWSLLPLLVVAGAAFGWGWYGWEPAVRAVRGALERWDLLAALFHWLDAIGAPDLRPVLAPVLVVAVVAPALVMATLLAVVWVMAPAMASLVARRRFPALARSVDAPGPWGSLRHSLAGALVAALALVLSAPLWLVPPLVLVLPPLVWGWLCYRALSFDALSRHASADERRILLHQHRWPLRLAGFLTALAASTPLLLWGLGIGAWMLAPWLMLAMVWAYTVLFTYASLWFAHYALAALARLRGVPAVLEPADVLLEASAP